MLKSTVRSGSNIAFIKYWGVDDPAINLPCNSSISMTLNDAYTLTTVEWDVDGRLTADKIALDGARPNAKSLARLTRHLDRLRTLAGVAYRACVESKNNFPMASGIASSASGFSALTVAGANALGLELAPTRLAALARLESGSAGRSLFGGFVEWTRGHDDASSVVHQLYPAEHWELFDVVVVVSRAAKETSSANGHLIAATSPLHRGRVDYVDGALDTVRAAIAERDLHTLGPVIEQDTLAMHGVMMTGRPSLIYWQPATISLIQAVRRWREEDGVAAYFTIDAGPNLHLICEKETVPHLQERLRDLAYVEQVIVSRPGPGVVELDNHLF